MLRVLMLHGNGGSTTRFRPFLELVRNRSEISFHIPSLSGFDGRPLPKSDQYWDLFLSECEKIVGEYPTDKWAVYGHGIGGSLLLELANRKFAFPGGTIIEPESIILHSCVGASLSQRWFPSLMKPKIMRSLIHRMIYSPLLRSMWERRLFLHPENIPDELKTQFFEDYRHCAAFPVWFDLITPAWYRSVVETASTYPLSFLWGAEERVIKAKYLPLWQQDFPNANIDLVEDWDHFPMLDSPQAFTRKLLSLLDA